MKTRRGWCVVALAALAGLLCAGMAGRAEEKKVTRFVRFQADKKAAYGVVEGDTIHAIKGTPFGKWQKTDQTHPLAKVKVLVPTRPTQVFAMAGNYKSHHRDEAIPEKFKVPQLFLKPPSCLVATGEHIVLPRGTADVHYEAELVLVIGKRAKNVSKEKALDYVLGATCGNDVSARDWQKNDVQWWRAKGSDTFGPVGPFIVSGLNYDDLEVQMRLNGAVKQKQRTRDLIHDVRTMVSFISQHATLQPGDLIYTGTPGKTSAIKPGDVCEVEIEGIGVLRNGVTAAR